MQLKDGIVLEGNAQHFLKKSVGDLPAVKPMFEQFFADTTVAFYGLYEPLMPPFVYGFTKSEREDIIYTKIDSIETIDPETYERHLLIAPIVGCKPEDIKRLEIVQNWYWDDKKKQMGVYFKAVAPLKEEEVSYNGREFVYKRIFPVFYKPTGE